MFSYNLGYCLVLQFQVLKIKSAVILSGRTDPTRACQKKDFNLRKIILQTLPKGWKSRTTMASTSAIDRTIEQLGHSMIQSSFETSVFCRSPYFGFSVQSSNQSSSSKCTTPTPKRSPNFLATVDFHDQAGQVMYTFIRNE